MKGRIFLVRFADDFILGFEHKGRRGESLSGPLQTLREIRAEPASGEDAIGAVRATERQRADRRANGSKAGHLRLSGLYPLLGEDPEGRWVIRRKTMRKRLTRGLKAMSQWCRKNLHEPMREQVEALGRKLKGHFGYYGITGNYQALQRFRWEVIEIWRKWLARRGDSQRDALGANAPPARVLLPSRSPSGALCLRSETMTPKNRMREIALVRVCGGAGGQPPALPGAVGHEPGSHGTSKKLTLNRRNFLMVATLSAPLCPRSR